MHDRAVLLFLTVGYV